MNSTKKSYDDDEIARFDQLARNWWDENGPMRPLHQMNPTRLSFIRQHIDHFCNRKQHGQRALKKLSVLDIGCGGGILSEPLARLGANVSAIDLSNELIEIAKQHAIKTGLSINYQCVDAYDLLKKRKRFDIITALEVIEHVPNPEEFIKTATELLKPGGILFLSTLNRTPASYLTAIIGAEYVLRWLPKGTHQWQKFIKPSEIADFLGSANFKIYDLTGITYNPLNQAFALNPNRLNVNYILCAVKK